MIPRFLCLCLLITLIPSCIKRPDQIETKDKDEVSNHISELTEFEKQNRKNKDTIFLNLILGSSRPSNNKILSTLSKKNIISFENSAYAVEFENLPMISFRPIYFNDTLESIVAFTNLISFKENNNLTYLLSNKYGSCDITYTPTFYDYDSEILYWILGDLLIKKEASFFKSEHIYVTITYTKLSIKERHEKEKELETKKEFEILKQEERKRVQKEDSISRYF